MTTFPEPEPLEAGTPQQVAEDALLDDVAAQVDELEAVLDIGPLDFPRRLLLVHAHPDDEVVGTGATMAQAAVDGALVVLVTCTRGELGEVVDPALADLAATGPDDDRLGEHRVQELAASCEALGVQEHRFLGGPGRWRDSGMLGEPSNDDPRCFWRADLAEATGDLVGLIREFRPQVVVTYDDHGMYGHPDHVQAQRVTVAALDVCGDPSYRPDLGEPWEVAKLFETAIPRSFIEQARESGAFEGQEGDMPRGSVDADIDALVDGSGQRDAKLAAMRAHKSQVDLEDPFWHMLTSSELFGHEHYRLARGQRNPGAGPHGWETSLFDGLER